MRKFLFVLEFVGLGDDSVFRFAMVIFWEKVDERKMLLGKMYVKGFSLLA